jgi:hypothetical protein
VEGHTGEQWVFVSPSATAQSATPVAQISGPGMVAAAMTATSNLGTITVKTLTVDVVAGSSALVSTASDALYYTYTPVAQSLFADHSSGGLAEESWDGAGWLDQNVPGDVAAGSPVAVLQYKNSGGTLEPHVFARSVAGSLIEATPAGGAWSTVTLPGSVAPASAIAATTIADGSTSEPAYPAVFSYDAAGRLTETYRDGGAWTTAVLPAPPSSPGAVAVATSFQGGVPVPQVYSVSSQGQLVVTSQLAGQWQSTAVPSSIATAPATSLAAVSSPAEGSAAAAFFVDRAGHVAEVSQDATGSGWTVDEISATAVAPGGTLLASNFVPSSGSPQPDVFALSTSGRSLLISSSSGGAWATQALPGTATSLLALGDYAVPGSPQSVFFSSAQGDRGGQQPQRIGRLGALRPAAGHSGDLPWTGDPLRRHPGRPDGRDAGRHLGRAAILGGHRIVRDGVGPCPERELPGDHGWPRRNRCNGLQPLRMGQSLRRLPRLHTVRAR